MRKHWYYVSIVYCPVCGRDNTYKERRFGRRPKRWQNRHSYEEVYDGCPL